MKKIIILFFIVIGNFSNAQVKYHFDYALLYDNEVSFDAELKSNLFLINSKDNSYITFLSFDKDSINVSLKMIDYEGIIIQSKIKRALFFKAETLNFDCESVFHFSNQYKYKSKEYSFQKYNDTLINDTIYFHYAIKSVKSLKYQKRKKIVSTHFIVDKNSSQFSPFFYHSTIYNNWIKTLKLPNGIIKIKYDIDVDGKIIFKQELKKIIKIDKYLTFPNECRDFKSPKLFSQ